MWRDNSLWIISVLSFKSRLNKHWGFIKLFCDYISPLFVLFCRVFTKYIIQLKAWRHKLLRLTRGKEEWKGIDCNMLLSQEIWYVSRRADVFGQFSEIPNLVNTHCLTALLTARHCTRHIFIFFLHTQKPFFKISFWSSSRTISNKISFLAKRLSYFSSWYWALLTTLYTKIMRFCS